ncbi:MAG: PPC domain-containing DNA-binding protein [Actinomycetota bacterium]
MKTYPSTDGKAVFVRLPRGSDLLEGLNEAARELGIEAGTLQVIGAVSRLALGQYDQDAHEYTTHEREGGHELASGLGNVSLRDGAPFVHLHVVASATDGSILAGHLMPGTTVFLAEAYFRRLDGPPPVRSHDEDTGLPAWQ